MNRLIDIHLGSTHSQICYDPLGRMTSKQADGQTVFANANFTGTQGQPARPHAMKSAETTANVFPAASQAVTYTGFDKVKTIHEGGNGLEYTYGYDRQRIRMTDTVGGTIRNKDYVGMCEYITEDDGNAVTTKTRTYLTGPFGVFAVVEQRDNEETIHYILKDNLGSWTTIIDGEGNVEQELSFDAWGNLRNPETWSGSSSAHPMFDRGYTGHEHITGFGLINMNGRCYDPLTSAFLSVDAYVQDPASAQAFNRYAYCSHNPLRFTDPTGWYQQPGTYGINPNFNPGGHTTYHSDDPNDMLWGRTNHPHANSSSGCVNGNSVTKTEYTQGNDGSHGSNYTVDRKGYVKNVGENNLTYDVLYTADAYAAGDFSNGLVVYDLSLLSGLMEDRSMYWLWTGNGQGHSGHYSSTEYIDDAFMVFHYMAINTDVEWEISGYRTNGPNEYVIATTHSINSTRTVSSLDQYSVYNQIFEIHNHPDIDGTKGGSWVDVKNINKIHQTDFNSQDIHHWFIHNGQSTIFPKHYVYHNHSSVLYYYLPDGRNDIYIRKINTYKDLYQNLGF